MGTGGEGMGLGGGRRGGRRGEEGEGEVGEGGKEKWGGRRAKMRGGQDTCKREVGDEGAGGLRGGRRGVGGGRGENNWEREGHGKRGKFCARTLRGREEGGKGGRPPLKYEEGREDRGGSYFFFMRKAHIPLRREEEDKRSEGVGAGGGDPECDSIHYSCSPPPHPPS